MENFLFGIFYTRVNVGNDFIHWYRMLTNNANKQTISFRYLLNQMKTGEYDMLFCNRKVKTVFILKYNRINGFVKV